MGIVYREGYEQQRMVLITEDCTKSRGGYWGQRWLLRTELVCWWSKPSQHQRILLGLRKTFIKRYIVERTNKTELRRRNRVRKRRLVGRIYGMKHNWKAHKDRNRHKNRIKRSGQARLIYVSDVNHNIPTMWWSARGEDIENRGYWKTGEGNDNRRW